MNKNWKGIITVVCTPFDKDDRVDEKKLRNHVEALVQTGLAGGIMPCGGTGESILLSQDEWETVARVVIETVDSRVPVIVGCSDVSTRNTVKRMKFAEKTGADGAMVSPPWYIGPSDAELYEHFKVLAGESGLPTVLYNNPHGTGVDVKPEMVAKIAELGQVKYKKMTSGDMTRLAAIERLCGDKVKFLIGCDPLALEMFLMGAVGWIAPCGNFMLGKLYELYDLAVNKKDLAKAKQLYFKMLPMFSLFETGVYIQLSKYGMNALGMDYGAPRRPLLPPSLDACKAMDGMMKDLGLL